MKITVGIPCYNQAEYLSEAIESVLNQTYKDIELIIVNDGSEDDFETISVARKYAVKLINQVNKGLSSARNTAIMNMTGDYFLPLDADDILLDNCVEKIVEFAKNTNADIIAPSFLCFGLGHQEVKLLPTPILKDFKEGNRLGYFSAIKKGVLLEVGGYSPRMTWGAEDYHLWINLLVQGYSIATIPETLVLYRIKENSMWTETQKYKKEYMAQIEKDFPEFRRL